MNIKIIGTHHLMKEEEIRKEIDSFNPEIILIELCNGRISVKENPHLQKKEFSLLGLISSSIHKKAKSEKLEYGSDMYSAYKIAKEKNIPIGLIDRPLVETQILFKAIPMKEKYIMFKEVMKFNSKKVKMEDTINQAMSGDINKMIDELKNQIPNFHYFIVSSRDEYMIAKIKSYLYDYPDKKILCFVGKGHLEKINNSLGINNQEIKPVGKELKGGQDK